MVTSLAAVFSPMPGTPGRLSLGSPRSAAYSGYCAGGDAGALDDPRLVVEHVVGHAAPVVEHLDVRVADELVGVAVAGDDDDVDAGGRRLRRRAWRSRRRPRRPRPASVGMRSASITSWISGSCGTNMSGVSLRLRLVRRRRGRRGTCGPARRTPPRCSSGCSSPSTFTSIDVNPKTALVIVPFGRGEVGGERVEGAVRERQPVDQQQLRCRVSRRRHARIVRPRMRRFPGC